VIAGPRIWEVQADPWTCNTTGFGTSGPFATARPSIRYADDRRVQRAQPCPRHAKTPARSRASGGGRCREAVLRTRVGNRAKSWTLYSVADAKRSATRSFRVASCRLHTSL